MSLINDAYERCDGVTRRDILRVGSLVGLGFGLFHRLGTRVANAGQDGSSSRGTGAAKSCILIWLDGGPSHLETFDPKPSAPSEVRGPFAPIATSVPGVQVCELLPKTAGLAKEIAIIRSMTSPLGEHGIANAYLLSGYKPSPVLDYPSYGAVVAHLRQGAHVLPPYVAIPEFRGTVGAGFLGAAARPFATGGDPAMPDFQVRDLDFFPGVNAARLERRRAFVTRLDRFQQSVEGSSVVNDPEFEQAYRLVTSSKAKQAFDLSGEKPEIRARYGPRTLGQSCLLARRLVERGVPFVSVVNTGWDTHEQLVLRLRDGYSGAQVGVGLIPTFDLAFAALVEDLKQRGLLDETLVIAMGEFGRTPKLNTNGGRDHWPRVFSVVLAGGGVPGGQVIGASDRNGESAQERPVTPADLARTIYTLLGINPDHELHTDDGRPVPVNQGGKLIEELLA